MNEKFVYEEDPVVAEVRRAREELFARYQYDVDLMFAEMERRQATDGRQYATIPPVAPSLPTTKKAG